MDQGALSDTFFICTMSELQQATPLAQSGARGFSSSYGHSSALPSSHGTEILKDFDVFGFGVCPTIELGTSFLEAAVHGGGGAIT